MKSDVKKKAKGRLARIAGQVGGLQRMLEDDRYCVDILLQIAAVQAALGQLGKVVLGSHVETCVSDAIASGRPKQRREKIDELMQVFSRYGHMNGR